VNVAEKVLADSHGNRKQILLSEERKSKSSFALTL